MVLCGQSADHEKEKYACFLFSEITKFQNFGLSCDVKVPGELRVASAHARCSNLMSESSSASLRSSSASSCSMSSCGSDEYQYDESSKNDWVFAEDSRQSDNDDDDAHDVSISPQQRLDALNDLRLHSCGCDVTIVADQFCCDVHKVVLAACSDYFKAMFASNMKESAEKTIVLHNISSVLTEKVINFMYTGDINMDADESVELLKIAVYYQIMPLRNRCQSALIANLSTSNCCFLSNVASDLALKDFHSSCVEFIFKHFMELNAEYDEVELLLADDLVACVERDDLGNGVCSSATEEHVLQIVLHWLSHNWSKTNDETQVQIAENVRLALIRPDAILRCCESMSKDLNNNSKGDLNVSDSYGLIFAEQLARMLDYHERVFEQPLLQSRTTQLRTSQQQWCCADGVVAQRPIKLPSSSSNIFYNFENLVDEEGENRPIRDPYHSVVEFNGFLYVIGSTRRNRRIGYGRCVHRYDPRLDVTVRVADMQTERGDCVVCVVGGCIYVVGGRNRHGALSSCEKYDPRSNVWSKIADLPQASYMAAGLPHNGSVYVTGGFSDYDTVGCTYRYDAEEGQWSEIFSPMLSDRGFHALVEVHDGRLWAIGGVDHPFSGRNVWEVEALDVDDDLWTFAGQVLPIQPFLSTMRINTVKLGDGRICVFAVTSPHRLPMLEYIPDKKMWFEMKDRLSVCEVLTD